MSSPVTIRSGEKISSEKSFVKRLKKIIALCDAILNCKNIKVSDNNIFIQASAGPASGVDIAGEWDPGRSYAAKVIVFFTPPGASAGTFYSLQPVAVGVSPDTGAPNWASFPSAPPGMWGT